MYFENPILNVLVILLIISLFSFINYLLNKHARLLMNYKSSLNLNSEDYDFEAYIIAIGKDSNNEIRVFNMKEDNMLNDRISLISNILKRISWHISTDQWEHSQEYYESDGTEELNG